MYSFWWEITFDIGVKGHMTSHKMGASAEKTEESGTISTGFKINLIGWLAYISNPIYQAKYRLWRQFLSMQIITAG